MVFFTIKKQFSLDSKSVAFRLKIDFNDGIHLRVSCFKVVLYSLDYGFSRFKGVNISDLMVVNISDLMVVNISDLMVVKIHYKS